MNWLEPPCIEKPPPSPTKTPVPAVSVDQFEDGDIWRSELLKQPRKTKSPVPDVSADLGFAICISTKANIKQFPSAVSADLGFVSISTKEANPVGDERTVEGSELTKMDTMREPVMWKQKSRIQKLHEHEEIEQASISQLEGETPDYITSIDSQLFDEIEIITDIGDAGDDSDRIKQLGEEIEKLEKEARELDEEIEDSKLCLKYCLSEQAGSCPKRFQNNWKMDCGKIFYQIYKEYASLMRALVSHILGVCRCKCRCVRVFFLVQYFVYCVYSMCS